jgi:hypothetical protein
MDDHAPRLPLLVDSFVATLAAASGAIDPMIGVGAAAAAPAALAGAHAVIGRMERRRAAKRAAVIASAAQYAGIDAAELDARLRVNPDGEELLLRTLRASEDTGLTDKLIAYSIALGTGAKARDNQEVRWETAFVAALDDLNADHLCLLQKFTSTATELGIRQPSPDVDTIMAALSQEQIERVSDDVANLPAAPAVLQRHGLIENLTLDFTYGAGGSPHWRLTSFGHDVAQRLKDIDAILHGQR